MLPIASVLKNQEKDGLSLLLVFMKKHKKMVRFAACNTTFLAKILRKNSVLIKC